MPNITQATNISSQPKPKKWRFSIATLVTQMDQYQQMLRSFEQRGFTAEDCEFLYINNVDSNQHHAFSGLNLAISQASGEYLILCHQDIELIDSRAVLENRIDALNTNQPHWGVAGNAGGKRMGEYAIRITDPLRDNASIGGPFPARVSALDENFLLLKADANLGFSRDLTGFHAYGLDIVQQAENRGYSAWVIDYHLQHYSTGDFDQRFSDSIHAYRDKAQRLKKGRWIVNTSAQFYSSGNELTNRLLNAKRVRKTWWSIKKRTGK